MSERQINIAISVYNDFTVDGSATNLAILNIVLLRLRAIHKQFDAFTTIGTVGLFAHNFVSGIEQVSCAMHVYVFSLPESFRFPEPLS